MFFIINTGIISDPPKKDPPHQFRNTRNPPKNASTRGLAGHRKSQIFTEKGNNILVSTIYIYIYILYIYIFVLLPTIHVVFYKCCYGYGPWQHHEKVQLK